MFKMRFYVRGSNHPIIRLLEMGIGHSDQRIVYPLREGIPDYNGLIAVCKTLIEKSQI